MTTPRSRTVGAISQAARRPCPALSPPLLCLAGGTRCARPDVASTLVGDVLVDMGCLLAREDRSKGLADASRMPRRRCGPGAGPSVEAAPHRALGTQPAEAAEMAAFMSLTAWSTLFSPLMAA